ncbi:MAG: hypothetical protein OEZ23_04000 [Gammaproteobacteria bacterium]|nr:hypothetical protein [Gammaproteobacteria bacterium]
MMQVIVSFIQAARRALSGGIAIETLRDLPVCRQIKRMGEEIGDNEIEQLRQLGKSLNAIFETLHEEQVT